MNKRIFSLLICVLLVGIMQVAVYADEISDYDANTEGSGQDNSIDWIMGEDNTEFVDDFTSDDYNSDDFEENTDEGYSEDEYYDIEDDIYADEDDPQYRRGREQLPDYEKDWRDEEDDSQRENRKKNVKAGPGFGGISCDSWIQRMSKNKALVASGCRIVTFTRMLYQAGFTEVGDPDNYFAWGRKNGGFTETAAEYTPFGSSIYSYVKSHDGKVEIVSEYSIDGFSSVNKKNIMKYLSEGYFVMIWGKDHQTMFSNKESVKKGTPVICDTYSLSGQYAYGQYKNYIKLSDYGRENQAQYYDHITVFSIMKNGQENPNKFVDYDGNDENRLYRISYWMDGGINGFNPSTYSKGDEFALKRPSKNGYQFMGWFLEENFQTEITGITRDMCEDLVVFARWSDGEDTVSRDSWSGAGGYYEEDVYGSSEVDLVSEGFFADERYEANAADDELAYSEDSGLVVEREIILSDDKNSVSIEGSRWKWLLLFVALLGVGVGTVIVLRIIRSKNSS